MLTLIIPLFSPWEIPGPGQVPTAPPRALCRAARALDLAGCAEPGRPEAFATEMHKYREVRRHARAWPSPVPVPKVD